MRDPTKRRNYSVEAEEFRREHAARRVWGLQQRHARKMRSLHGSTSAAWADYQQRIEELQSPVCAAPADDEAGPPARAGFDSTTGTASATPGPALPQTAPPETAPPETAPPETAPPVATTSAQVQDIPVVCDASTSEVLIPEAILAETATTEPTAGRGQISPAPAHPRAPHRSRPSSPRSNRYPRGGQREHRQPPAHKMTTVRHGAAPPRPASRNPADKRPPPDPTGNPGPTKPDNKASADENRPLRPGAERPKPVNNNLIESAWKQPGASNSSAARGNSCRHGTLLRTRNPKRLKE
jgi:hypothetical protein